MPPQCLRAPSTAPEPAASVEHAHLGAVTRVRVRGEVDLATVPALTHALARPEGGHPTLVLVDMRLVTFLDLCATHVLLDAHDAVAYDDGRMVVVRGRVSFDRWLPLIGLGQRLEVVDMRPELRRLPGT